jgi:hypothetical protein
LQQVRNQQIESGGASSDRMKLFFDLAGPPRDELSTRNKRSGVGKNRGITFVKQVTNDREAGRYIGR